MPRRPLTFKEILGQQNPTSFRINPTWFLIARSADFISDICNRVWPLITLNFLSGDFWQLEVRWVIMDDVRFLL